MSIVHSMQNYLMDFLYYTRTDFMPFADQKLFGILVSSLQLNIFIIFILGAYNTLK